MQIDIAALEFRRCPDRENKDYIMRVYAAVNCPLPIHRIYCLPKDDTHRPYMRYTLGKKEYTLEELKEELKK